MFWQSLVIWVPAPVWITGVPMRTQDCRDHHTREAGFEHGR